MFNKFHELIHDLGSFEEDFQCQKDSDCNDANVNNCQHGYCMCGDHAPCSVTSDTCINATDGGTIYDATCKCGQNLVCSMFEICENGICAETTYTASSSVEDSVETYTTSSIEGSGSKYNIRKQF